MAYLDANIEGHGTRVQRLADTSSGIWIKEQRITRTTTTLTEVRQFAGGKRRAISWGADEEIVNVDLSFNQVSDMDTLQGWVDEILVMRSVHGQVLIGVLSLLTTDAPTALPFDWAGGQMEITTTTDTGTLEGVRRR